MSLRKNFSNGIFYTGITRYSGVLISIVIGAILARLLTPEEFGVVALITVFITFFNLLTDVGIGPAIIQNKELTEGDVESIFLLSILLGLILAITFFFSAQLISSFYNNESLIPLIRLLSLTVFFSALRIVPNALLLKKFAFKQIGIVTISVQLLSGILAIFFAYKGYSYYALVYKSIFDSLFTFFCLYWISPVKLKFIVRKSAINKIMRFSSFQFLFNFINYFSRNSDNLLIGKFLSPASLGFYDKSYQLMMMPVQNLTHVITPVLHPVLSNYQDDKTKIYIAYIKVVKLLATIGFPLSIFLHFSAAEIIMILYGSQWEAGIPVFKILALTIGLQIVLSSSGSIFQAINRTDLLFYSGTISAVFMVSGICYGIFIGKSLESIGYGLIVAFGINFFQSFYFLVKIGLNNSLSIFFKNFLWPILISLLLILILFFFKMILIENKILSLCLKFITCFTVTSAILLFKKENRNLIFKNK